MRPPAFRGAFRDDPVARAAYSEAAGIGREMPTAVAVPEDVADVQALVRWARETGTPLVPRGSGSSMAGGAIGAGVVVDLSRLALIGAVDVEGRRVWVGPGAVRGAVNRAAGEHGLRFPVDPSSGNYCTVGGMASTNAAGAHTLKYGPTRGWVTAIECVFDDGTRSVVRRGEEITSQARLVPAIGRFAHQVMPSIFTTAMAEPVARIRHLGVRKDSSGYALGDFARTGHLVDLLVGSEGTLALFVGLELKLAPLPGATASALAAFPTLEQAVAAAVGASEAGASACELLDRTFLEVAALGPHAPRLPEGTEAVLLTEVEGDGADDAAAAARSIERLFAGAGASEVALALDAAAEHELWELRHAASPILARLDPALKSMQFIEDGAVPPRLLPEYVRGVRAALDRHGLRGVIFGHAGDAHVHVNPLVDVGRPGWRDQVSAVLEEVVDLTGRLGGTLAGEHGDGRLRTPLLARTWAKEATVLFELVKRSFDPSGILNPGVKVPVDGQTALGLVKYDPTIEALPPAARRALDRVAEERAYDRLRLDLLDEASGADESRSARSRGRGRSASAARSAASTGAEYEDEPPGGNERE
jgi:FAD/FMN-containing dehydrogenase